MSKFSEYINKPKEEFFQQESTTQLEKEKEIGGDFDYSGEELKERFLQRQNEGNIKDRARYYFEEEGMMHAKATRYRSIADHGDTLRQYSRKYSNHSASKRRKSARKAADSFDAVAELEKKYSGEKTDSVTSLKHKEEIIRARLKAMKKAAEVKSRSKKNEAYRKLKAEVSCLTILKEQADDLFEKEKKQDLKKKLGVEVTRITGELTRAQDEIVKMAPSPVMLWEKEMGIPDEIPALTKKYKLINKDVDNDSAEFIKKMKTFSLEMTRPENMETLRAIQENGIYPGYKANKGDVGRFLSFSFRAVLRDKKGMPINATELKKAEHNKKWLNSLATNNVEAKNEVLLESIKHYMSLKIPSPKEFKERGMLYYLRKNPAEFQELEQMTISLTNITNIDPFMKDYYENNAEFAAKAKVASSFTMLTSFIWKYKYLFDQMSHEGEPGDKSIVGVSRKSKKELKDANYEDILETYFQRFETTYNEVYSKGPVRGEILEKMNDRQKDAITTFMTKFTDSEGKPKYLDNYDKEMSSKLYAYADTKLGKELLDKEKPEDMVTLTGQAYDKAIGKAPLSLSEKQKRAEATVEKKSLQSDMRENLNEFLVERTNNISKGLETDFYSYLTRKDKYERNPDQKVEAEGMDTRYLQFAYDWSNYSTKSTLGISQKIKKSVSEGTIPAEIKRCGNTLIGLDLSMFDYKSDEEFVSKLKSNYMWLQRAESLEKAYETALQDRCLKMSSDFSKTSMETRFLALKEIKADYDARIAMINSPYYALLAEGDLKKLSDEELRARQENADQDDPQLSEFLKNYRLLDQKKTAFKKGEKAKDREKALSEIPKQTAANDMENRLAQMRQFGLLQREGESQEDYEKRMVNVLLQNAQEKVPKVDGEYVRNNIVIMETAMGFLLDEDIRKYENWVEDCLDNVFFLLGKGATKDEIENIKKMRQISYDARRSVEIQYYINNELGVNWKSVELDKPEENEKVNKNTYDILNNAYKTFGKVCNKIGVPKEQKYGPEIWYVKTMGEISTLLADHNIFYNQNVDEKIEVAKDKEKKRVEKDIEEGKKMEVTIAGKKYVFPEDMPKIKNFDGKMANEESLPLIEETISKMMDVYYTLLGNLKLAEKPAKGDTSFDYSNKQRQCTIRLNKLFTELEGIINSHS